MDLSKLSDDDLLALKVGDLSKVSDAGLLHMKSQSAPPAAPSMDDAPLLFGASRNQLKTVGAGLVRGARDIVDTGAGWLAKGLDKVTGADAPTLSGLVTGKQPGGFSAMVQAGNKQGTDEFNRDYGDSGLASAARFGGNVLATPVGPVLATGAKLVGAAPRVVNALASSGMTTGAKVAPNLLARGGDAALRAGAGAVTGGAAGALVDPSSAGAAAGIGAVTPGVLKLVGMAGTKVYQAFRAGQTGAGRLLADAMGVSEPELQQIIAAANAAPDALVPGSKLTLSQALQTQGANQPGVKMLERVVAGGPGGDALLRRYEDQGGARLMALLSEGAQTYQGAAREEATRAGNKIGAVLRTQAADDRDAARSAWEALHGRASREGVALELPLDQMSDAMAPLGRGSVISGKDANAVLRTANEIGTDTLAGSMPTTARVGETANDKTLGQAVRAIGIHPDALSPGGMGGEVRWLRESLKGGRGLVNKNGKSLDNLSERMYEAGYLDQPDPSELLSKLAQEAQGAPVYSSAANGARAQYLLQGGDIPARAGLIVPKPVPFDEFQRLRRDSGALGAKAADDASRGAEARVLRDFEAALSARADDAAAGNLRPGEVMPAGFREQYNAARGMTRANAERYKQGNNIGSILRQPAGQDYTLTGDEITNKLWHGGAGLAGDVSNLRNVLSANNLDPVLNVLRGHVMTDAASRTTAAGQFGSALPKYVEQRMPGLQELLTPSQLQALTGVAGDIRNAEAAGAVPGLRGSDTQAKIMRAMDAGLLDSGTLKTLARFMSVKGIGLEPLRAKMAETVMQHKGRTLAELLTNPKAAAAALQDRGFTKSLDSDTLRALRAAAHRGAPLLAAD